MDLQLTDKVAVVTGANKGIGLAITKALVAEGAYVVAGSLSTENLDGLDRVTAVAVNLLAEDGPALLVQKAIDEHGRLDVLVNNVGAVRIRVDGFLGHQRRGVRVGAADELLHLPTRDPGRSRSDARAGLGVDRQRRLCQLVLPA